MFCRSPHSGLAQWSGAAGALWMLAAGACQTRDRFQFSSTGDGIGPESVIEYPGDDTTVTAGPDFVVYGFSRDGDGVDTVYFVTEGGVTHFPPLASSKDSVRYALPITTSGQAGTLITLLVFGTDRFGVRGDTVIRHVLVR